MANKVNFIGVSIAAAVLLTGSAYAANAVNVVSADKAPVLQKSVKKTTIGTDKKLAVQYAEGEVIVQYKANVAASRVNSTVAAKGLTVAKQYATLSSQGKGTYIKVTGKLSTEQLLEIFKADPNVEAVSPNFIRRLDVTPNDPDFTQVWGMHNTGQTVNGIPGTADADIDAPQAWDLSIGSNSVVVAVFDTGVDYTHEDLAANMWINPGEIAGNGVDDDANGYIDDVYGADVAADLSGTVVDGDPMDIHGHGTHCSGTIGAVGNNGIGVTGVNWNVDIMAMKVFRPDMGAYDDDILDAIDYVLAQKANGVNIVSINASYGGYGGDQTNPMNAAIKSLGDQGIVFCAAAGNDAIDNDAMPHFPSSYNASNIIAVAASDQNDALASFSNYGASTVDLAAPGVNIRSTLPGGGSAGTVTPIITETFDPFAINWYTSGTTNWAITNEDSFSPVTSVTDSPGASYLNDTDSIVFSDPIDLSAETGDLAYEFMAKLDVETGWDYLSVEVSNDGGATWMSIATYDGIALPWQSYSGVIPAGYNTANFAIGFRLVTDGSITYDGVHIDDVTIGVSSGGTGSNNYDNWDGTSMATPAVAGAVALLASEYPGETAAQRKLRLTGTVDTKAAFTGKMVTDGRMNIAVAIDPGTSTRPPVVILPSDDGGIPAYDMKSMLMMIFGFLAIGGLIARRKLA